MGKTALLFPGQGVQFVGMGKDLYTHFSEAKDIIDQTNAVLDCDLKSLMFEGPIETLTQTENAQPAILAVSYAFYRLASRKTLTFSGTAGHSLGEYNALIAAEAITFQDALITVRERGRLMEEIGAKTKGTMAAILGLDEERLKEVCLQATDSGVVEIANYNCPGQLVISGEMSAVTKACDLAKKAGAKRALKLNVSGAFHSSLLKEASDRLGEFLDGIMLQKPLKDFYQNVSGDKESDPSIIRGCLKKQVSSPVKWEHSIRTMIADGYDSFIEIGPGTVLTGLVSQISKDVKRININTTASIEP